MSGENVFLALLVGLTALVAALAYLAFRCWRIHERGEGGTALRGARLLAGNLLILAALVAPLTLAGEIYYRFVYDASESFGLSKTNLRWFLRHYQKNNLDIRDDVDYAARLAPGRRRVTFIGDSFTAAQGIADVEERFANRVRRTRPDWEVHALAVNGWDTREELGFLSGLVEKPGLYDLDVVVLVYTLNDLVDLLPEWTTISERIYRQHPEGWLTRSSFLLNTIYCRHLVATDPDLKRYFSILLDGYRGPGWEKQAGRLERLRDVVEGHGGKLAVITFPYVELIGPGYPLDAAHERLDLLWQRLGVPHLDLRQALSGHASGELVVGPREAHPSALAHRLAAEAMLPFLDGVVREQGGH